MARETREAKSFNLLSDEKARQLVTETAVHRRILRTINNAVRAEDLLEPDLAVAHAEAAGFAQGTPAGDDHGPTPIHDETEKVRRNQRDMHLKTAKEIIAFRDTAYPLGLRHLEELERAEMRPAGVYQLFQHLQHAQYGRWADFPVNIPRRGPGSYDGVIHAALCHTGKVLFITADETTLLWDPNDTTASTFENPTNQPHLMPNGYSQLCGHHVFLSDGRLLSVGGGGYGYRSNARAGYIFDPTTKTWVRTSNNMSEAKWYPTAVALGDERVLVTCGDRGGDMDIYDEATDTFSTVTGDDRSFPNLYPGLHLLPNHGVFYSRTGWGSAGTGGSPSNDPRSAYFTFNGGNSGAWTNIQNATANRTKGMSVLLMSSTPPYVRVMVIGGVGGDRGTYEIADVTSLSGATSWGPATPFPDGLDRSLASAVLLPDGNVFVAGGTTQVNSPCSMFNPRTDTWSAMDELPSARHYHSVMILLPSGQVMMAGWNNTKIEIYDPPYMFAGSRPVISSAPSLIHHGRTFTIESPDAASITKVVLVRPMAVTHQTDSEQKVIEMPYVHDHATPSRIRLTAPDSIHPHSNTQKGYYMMFALNGQGVPSVAKWIYLH